MPADEVLGIEMLLSKDPLSEIPGFPVYVKVVQAKTEAANPPWDSLPYPVARVLRILGFAAAILTPLLLLATYWRFGREKEFTVPEYLSTVPNPSLKPWVVNLLFKGDAMVFDQDGYYATLLDLHMRKVITITKEGGGENIRTGKLPLVG